MIRSRQLLLLALFLAACGEVKDGDAADAAADDIDAAGEIDAAAPAAPTVSSVDPDWGSTAGGTRVAIAGSGFTMPGLTVTFGGDPGEVTVIDDTRLTVITPAGPHQAVAVEIASDLGTGSAGEFRYLAPLYAADGKGGTPGNLYIVDPTSGAATPVGPIGFGITGLELSPAGVLHGTTTSPPAEPRLVTIDPYTGTGTEIGPLLVGSAAAPVIHDITFVGDRLLGWNQQLVEIDLASAQVSAFSILSSGDGIATAADGTVYMVTSGNSALFTVNPDDGTLVPGPLLNGPMNTSVNALTVVGSTLYANIATTATSNLYLINPINGIATLVGALPVGIDALAGILLPATLAAAAPESVEVAATGPAPASCPGSFTVRTSSRRAVSVDDVLALPGRDVGANGRSRRVVPLASLGRLSARATVVELVGCGGDRAVVPLDAPGLSLTRNRRGRLKLIDMRDGFKAKLGDLVELRLR